MVYLAIREKKGEERKPWMGVYSFKKESDAWGFLRYLRHSKPKQPDYEEPCSYRIFPQDEEREAMTWADVTEVTGQNWTTEQNVEAIISARNPRQGRGLGFNAKAQAKKLRKQSNRNAERITGFPNWNRHKEKIVQPPTAGERLNEILNLYLRKNIHIVSMTFTDNSSSTVIVDDVWYITSPQITYQDKTFEGNTFQQIYNAARKVVPLNDLNEIVIGMAAKLKKSELDVINDMIFFSEFGQLRGGKTKEGGLTYSFTSTKENMIQYSILKSVASLTTIAPIQLSMEITDKEILKALAEKEKFGK